MPAAIDLEDWLFDDTAGRDAPADPRRGPRPGTHRTGCRGSVVDGRPADGERRSPSLTVAEAGGGAGNGRATDNARLVPSVTAVAVPPAGRSARDWCTATASSRATSPTLTGACVAPSRRTTDSRLPAQRLPPGVVSVTGRGCVDAGRRGSRASRCRSTRAS